MRPTGDDTIFFLANLQDHHCPVRIHEMVTLFNVCFMYSKYQCISARIWKVRLVIFIW